MGPDQAARIYKERFPKADRYKVTLYGSLAATGKGHLTDIAIISVLEEDKTELVWEPDTFLEFHPNGMEFETVDKDGKRSNSWTVFSVGGGDIVEAGAERMDRNIYPHDTMEQILQYCQSEGITMWEYVERYDEPDIYEYIKEVWEVMKAAVKKGLESEGTLPGSIKYPRKAAQYYDKAQHFSKDLKNRSMLYAYALAVSEENAGGGTIVTAPTCGACGVLPSVLYYCKKHKKASESRIYKAIATAGLIGTIVKRNASISGAEVGCQGEIGVACAMASGAATHIAGGTNYQIEYSAEMGLEHHLGLTCDPVDGLVQVPCIERNAFAAARAINHCNFALLSDGRHMISFDQVVETMKQTGKDLPSIYRETSEGGLAISYKKR